jgi:hypothetical protein
LESLPFSLELFGDSWIGLDKFGAGARTAVPISRFRRVPVALAP